MVKDEITYRPVSWETVDAQGIPTDLEKTRMMLNACLGHKSLRFIPRKKPFEIVEIRQEWMENNPALAHWIAIDEGSEEVIASTHIGRAIDDEHGKIAFLSVIVSPAFQGKGVGVTLCRLIIEDVLTTEAAVYVFTDMENMGMKKIVDKLASHYLVHGPEDRDGRSKYVVKDR